MLVDEWEERREVGKGEVGRNKERKKRERGIKEGMAGVMHVGMG